MKNKLFFSFIVLILFSCTTQNNVTSKSGSVFLQTNNIDLGTIDNSRIQSIPLTIANSTNKKIEIVNISKSCGCTQFELKKRSIDANSKLSFTLKYDPKDDLGKINRSVVLRLSNDDFLVFKFKGTVTNKKSPLS